VIAEVALLDAHAPALLRLGALHSPQRLLLLGQGRLELRVLVVLPEALGRQLRLRGREDGLAEALDAQLPHERQPCGREQHLLAYGRRVGDVGDGDEAVGGVGPAAQDYVGGLIVFKEGREEGEVVEEGGGGGDCGAGEELFGGNGGQETALGGGGDESVEGGVEVLGGWGRAG